MPVEVLGGGPNVTGLGALNLAMPPPRTWSTATARRAIRALEEARLVSVERRPGRGLEVMLLKAPADDAEAEG